MSYRQPGKPNLLGEERLAANHEFVPLILLQQSLEAKKQIDLMDRFQRLFQNAAGGQGGMGEGPPADAAQVDTSEQIYISSLALLKMLKHGK